MTRYRLEVRRNVWAYRRLMLRCQPGTMPDSVQTRWMDLEAEHTQGVDEAEAWAADLDTFTSEGGAA